MTKHQQNIYRGLILVLILGMGLSIGVFFYRARALDELRRVTNHMIANTIHVHLRGTHEFLTSALDRLNHPELGLPVNELDVAERELRAAETGSRIYSTALNYGLGDLHVDFVFRTLMGMYAQEIEGIQRHIRNGGSLSPDQVQSLTLMRDDLDLLIVNLPETLLAETDYETLAPAVEGIKPNLKHPIAQFMYGSTPDGRR